MAKRGQISVRVPRAKPHGPLVNESVYVFVDDQNLFWGIVNDKYGRDYRLDFGRLLLHAAKDSAGKTRSVASAYIAGVIPDDDSFWEVAKNRGFEVRRGILVNRGASQRSKQDDSYLVRDMTATICRKQGPSTIVLVAGDADYVPPLEMAVQGGGARRWHSSTVV